MDNDFRLLLVDYYMRRNEEIESIARTMTAQGLTGKINDPLPNLISSESHTWINNNLYAFRLKIRKYAE